MLFADIPVIHNLLTIHQEDHRYAVGKCKQGNKQRNLEFSAKALILFEFIDKAQKTYSKVRQDKMEAIRNRIAGLNTSNHHS